MKPTSDFRRKPTSEYEERKQGWQSPNQLLLFLINPKSWLVIALTSFVGQHIVLGSLYTNYDFYKEETEVSVNDKRN